jgi:hypothetical protein
MAFGLSVCTTSSNDERAVGIKKISSYIWSSFLAYTFLFSTILKRSLMNIGYYVNVYINQIRPVQVCADGFNSFFNSLLMKNKNKDQE